MDGWVTVGTKLDTKQLEKDIKSAENKMKQYEKEGQKLAQQKAKIDLDLSAYEEEKKKIQEVNDLTLKQAQTEEQVNFILQQENLEIEQLNQKYSQTFQKNENINKAIQQNTNQQGLLNNEIQEMNDKLNQSKGLDNIKKSISQASNSMNGVLKKVAKWGLAIFSIRSAYSLVRSSISTLSQYNDQFATDIEYIRYAIANSLQPVIITIINLVKKLLTYIGYIAKAWFGVDIWAKSSADNFAKAKDGVSGVSKEAKKLQKQLTGFDEMNILQEDGSTSTGGGGGGTPLPSFNLTAPEDVPIPSWVQWIVDNKDTVIGALAGITAGLVALNTFGLKPIMALGIGAIITGIVWLIQDVIDFLNDPTWQGFAAILGDIAVIIGGIMLVMGNWWGLLVVIVGAVVKLVAENWDKISEILGKIGAWIYETIIVPVGNFIKGLLDTVVSIIKTAISVIQGIFSTVFNIIANPFIVAKDTIVGVFNNIKSAISNIISGIKKLFTGDLKGALNDFKAAFKNVFNALWTIAKAPLNLIIGGINSLIKGANKISFDVPDWVPGLGGKKFGFHIPTIPKLAKGGIISQPGRGIPVGYGQAIGGEHGREGVIPLTDSQAMAQLGAEIGKNVVIQLTNITKLDSRQIARTQNQINAQNDFAFNR